MKRTTASMLAGVFLGVMLLSGAQAAVETYAAQRSAQRIYVDGKPVQIDSTTPYQDDTAEAQSGRIVTIPQSDENFVLKVGDRVRCDDGTLYEIKDMSRYDTNVFAEGPLPPLPTPTCDWSLFPQPELPKVEVKHFSSKTGDNLFVTNLYELRRMQYTIYNALGKEPDAWRGDQLLAKINLTIPPEYEPYTGTFWPWRESEDTVCQGYFRKK